MKKLIISLGIIGLLFGSTFAYQPTNQDIAQIKLLKTQLDSITTGNMKSKRDFYAQLKTLQEQFSNHEQLQYYFDELGVYLITQVNTEKVKAKIASKATKQDFVNQYSGGFSQEITTPDSCTGWYNTMDTISFANNFPTALTIATRYREVTCGYYMPTNGDGPFQIVSKDYGTGQMTEAKFLQTIQDFIDFSKAKHLQYKTKLGISLTYTGWDMTGLVNHAGLYNGGIISGNIVNPNNPHYVYDGYGQAYSGAVRYGLIPKFLKVLGRELQNSY
ncbi:MAG: hypothetical protein WC606_01780 [Candidatus Absconditabacterales bacterium]